MIDGHLTDRELASVLAGLRYWQSFDPFDTEEAEQMKWIADIADAGGTLKPLTRDEIDALCVELNTQPRPTGRTWNDCREVTALHRELDELHALPDDGPADVFADRRRAILNRLDELAAGGAPLRHSADLGPEQPCRFDHQTINVGDDCPECGWERRLTP